MGQALPKQGTYKFTVGDREFAAFRPVVTGQELREIAGISTKLRIFLRQHHPHEADREILHTMKVDLSQPGGHHFYTLPHPTMDIY